MTQGPHSMTCQEFQEQMADMIGSGQDLTQHPHLASCENCRALLADLQTIAEAARQLLPVDPPDDDLWGRIEIAIQKEEGSVAKD